MKNWIIEVEATNLKTKEVHLYGFQVDYVIELFQHDPTFKYLNDTTYKTLLNVSKNEKIIDNRNDLTQPTYP
jgi:hypothetical protein